MTGGGRKTRLLVASDKVGFAGHSAAHYVDDISYAMDTTDAFHTYTVIMSGETVSLFMDGAADAVISIPFDHFEGDSQQNFIRLATTSNSGTADFDVRAFYYNLDGTAIPEPSTLGLLAMGAAAPLVYTCRKRRRR